MGGVVKISMRLLTNLQGKRGSSDQVPDFHLPLWVMEGCNKDHTSTHPSPNPA